MVPSLPVITKTAFPNPALVTGIPSGSLSQGQVTRQVCTKTLAALAIGPSEITYFLEFLWVWGAQHHVSLLHYMNFLLEIILDASLLSSTAVFKIFLAFLPNLKVNTPLLKIQIKGFVSSTALC